LQQPDRTPLAIDTLQNSFSTAHSQLADSALTPCLFGTGGIACVFNNLPDEREQDVLPSSN
jgi:hypothetical protein